MDIRKDDKAFLKRYINNLDELLLSEDITELLLAIDGAMLDELDNFYNYTMDGVKLIHIYDRIYSNNVQDKRG